MAPPDPDRARAGAPVVTIAAAYGAGGRIVGPRVAERLGVPLLDRTIPEAVARETGLADDAVAAVDDEPHSRAERVFQRLGRAATLTTAGTESADRLDLQERRLRGRLEAAMAGAAESGGVVMGRGGMIVLRTLPRALHVLLTGPCEARIEQGMAVEGVDRETAQRHQEAEDRTRLRYVRRAYGADGQDASLYHLVLDSTAVDLDTCVELIATAALARTHRPKPTTPT